MTSEVSFTKSFRATAPELYAAANAALAKASGAFRIPISAAISTRPHRLETEILIEAKDPLTGAFPRFTGTLSVTPLREYGCELWLEGTYEVPLGNLGAAIDLTILRERAMRTLDAWFATIVARIALD